MVVERAILYELPGRPFAFVNAFQKIVEIGDRIVELARELRSFTSLPNVPWPAFTDASTWFRFDTEEFRLL